MRTYVNTFSNVTTKVLTYSLTQGFGLGPEDYPRDFLQASVVLTSSQTSEEEYPRAFLQALGVLASSHTSEEEHPRAFLQASEVSPPPILPKKTTQGLSFIPWVFSPPPILPKKSTRWPSFRPWKLSLPAWLSKKTTQGSDYSSSGGSRVLMMAFSNSAIPTAPRCIKGLPSIGMKRREGIERIPNRAASSFSSSTLTL